MTVINHDTGEIVETISADSARRLTTEARSEFTSAADHFNKGWAKVEAAVVGGGHLALGYRSSGDYLRVEFDGVLGDLDVANRRLAVRAMTDWGISSRAIAPVVGVSDRMVRKDQNAGGNSVPTSQAPAPELEGEAGEGAGQTEREPWGDARSTPEGEGNSASGADDPAPTEATSGDNRPEGYPKDPAPASRPPVTGIDGKRYNPPAPKPPKPVLDGQSAEYDNAEQASKSLARAIAKLLEFEHPNMRAGMRRYWDMASIEVPPAQRADVTTEQMRAAAHGLLALADEWNR